MKRTAFGLFLIFLFFAQPRIACSSPKILNCAVNFHKPTSPGVSIRGVAPEVQIPLKLVKGMLQHSRVSTGVKELIDINALADEYLRLSYHGLRAKDKSFNAEMKTDVDESIGKINIIPQDIGRVLLNLFNNAFYAVNEQKSNNLISYEPTVSVTTKKSENSVIITVSDNGNGIPEKVKDKIFQPFFT
ncbi:MAG: ATP-binding protein, partial [Ginsengibacter sp.]